MCCNPHTCSDCAPVFVVDASNVLGKGKVVNQPHNTAPHSSSSSRETYSNLALFEIIILFTPNIRTRNGARNYVVHGSG